MRWAMIFSCMACALWLFGRHIGEIEKTYALKLVILLLVMLAYFLLFAPLGAGESRFRAPADPLLGLLAGLAFFRPYKTGIMACTQLPRFRPFPSELS
jgi:hypothetical protein